MTGIPLTPDGDLKLSCTPSSPGQPGEAILALCGCLCCAAGNECLHNFHPWGASSAGGALPPGSPQDYFSWPNQPSGYQSLGRRFDLVHSQSRTVETGSYPDGEDGDLRIESVATTLLPRRERYRVAPFGLSDLEFAEQFGDGSPNDDNADDDTGGGTGWVRYGSPPVFDHATGQPVLELWVNPDELAVRTQRFESLGGEVITDTDVTTTAPAGLSNQVRIQDNTLGGVTPQRCDGVYWARPNPIAFDTLLGEGVWFGYEGAWGPMARPRLPMFTTVLVDDGNDGLMWAYAVEATLAGWEFLARGGMHSGGVSAYWLDDQGEPVEIDIPGASMSLTASVDVGGDGGGNVDPVDGHRSSCGSSLSSHVERVVISGPSSNPQFTNNGYESIDAQRSTELVVVAACDPGLESISCPDPMALDRAAIACDMLSAPVDIVGYDETTQPGGLGGSRRLEITFPQGAEPGSPGSSTHAYWATQIPTLAPRRDGVWVDGVCPEPMLAVACDGTGDSIAFDNVTADGVTVLHDDGGGERVYQRTTVPAPGALIVPDDELTWSDEPCPPPTGSVFERCPDHPLFLPTDGGLMHSPDRVSVPEDLPAGVRLAVMVVFAWTEDLPDGGTRVCRATGQFIYHRSDDQGSPSTPVGNYATSSAACDEIETKLLQSYCRIPGDNRPPDPVEFDLPAVKAPGDVRRRIDGGEPTGSVNTQAPNPMGPQLAYFGGGCCG